MEILVTGGGGFVGSHLIERLLGRGYKVRSLGRSEQPLLKEKGVDVRCADLKDANAVGEAVAGVDAVFHVAAKAGVWGSWQSYYDANVIGTRNVLASCADHGVARLIHTSTPSVVFNGNHFRGEGNELPYGKDWLCHYAHTKAIAEKEVLSANSDTLRVVALRPHLVFGPGDPHLLPRVIESVLSGRLRIVGEGTNRVDVSFVKDVAEAHLNAFDALGEGHGAGRAFFISQGVPVEIWPWLNDILVRLGHPPLTKKIPLRLAYAGGAVAECIWKVFSKSGEPPITRFVAVELAKDHFFSLDAAQHELGYSPAYSMDEAIQETVRDLKLRGF